MKVNRTTSAPPSTAPTTGAATPRFQTWERRGGFAPPTLTERQHDHVLQHAADAQRCDAMLRDIDRLRDASGTLERALSGARPKATGANRLHDALGSIRLLFAEEPTPRADGERDTDEYLSAIRHLFEVDPDDFADALARLFREEETPRIRTERLPGDPPAIGDEHRHSVAIDVPEAAAITEGSNSAGWRAWTVALVMARAAQGAVSTAAGRTAQEAVRVAAGTPQTPEEVSDLALAAGAALNIAEGALTAIRAFFHVLRATGQPEAYRQAFFARPPRSAGQPTDAAPTSLGTAGTPRVPASTLCRVLSLIAIPSVVFFLKAHTGLIALSHLGGDAPSKPDVYTALWSSNANSMYGLAREAVNAAADAAGVTSHHAPLTARGAIATGAVYVPLALAQRGFQDGLQTGHGPAFDGRYVAFSAVAEFVDVGQVALAQRLASPDQPVAFLRGRFSEQAGGAPHALPSVDDTLDRILLRGGSRDLVAQITQVVPMELGAALRATGGDAGYNAPRYAGAVLQGFTHLRELAWQAEAAAVRAGRQAPPSSEAGNLPMQATHDGEAPRSVAEGESDDIDRDIDDIV